MAETQRGLLDTSVVIALAIYGDTEHGGVKRHIDTEGREFFRRSSAED